MDDAPGSVSLLLERCLTGDAEAFASLCGRYHSHLVALSRRHLNRRPHCRLVDEQDLAQEALIGLHRMIRAGKPLVLKTRGNFLALLSCLVARNASKKVRAEVNTLKRGGAESLNEALLPPLIDSRLTPEEEAVASDLYEQCLRCLPDGPAPPQKLSLRRIAELYLAGYSQEEIAEALGCAADTVGRKLKVVKGHWQTWAARFSDGPAGGGPADGG